MTSSHVSVISALLNNSTNVIFVHNHPSGDPKPSAEDLEIEKKLKMAFDTVGIKMLDSVIIGRDSYYSATEQGTFGSSKPGVIMEHKNNEIEADEDACQVATDAALSVLSEQCSGAESDEPEQGRFLRLQIKQEIKYIHALALGTVIHPMHSAQSYANHTIKLIDNGIDSGLISQEFADVLKQAVQKAVLK